MASYAGEAGEIRVDANDEDGDEAFTDAQGTMAVKVWDIDKTTVLVDAAMTYDTAAAAWLFHWALPATPGAYLCRVTAAAVGRQVWAYKTIRVRQNKVPV